MCSGWTTPGDIKALFTKAATLTNQQLQFGIDVASSLLFQWSGRQFPGICQTTVRPIVRESWDDRMPSMRVEALATMPYGLAGFHWDSQSAGLLLPWARYKCGLPRERSCRCGPHELTLGTDQIDSILQVQIDGSVLAATEYEVHDRRWLVRMADGDGNRQQWPCCQRLDKPLGSTDTFGVTFTYGQKPPPDGVFACSWFALQIANDLAGAKCELPARVSNVTRQGVTAYLLDPMALLTKGLTGMPPVDNFLAAQRYGQSHRRASVTSVDLKRPVSRKNGPDGS